MEVVPGVHWIRPFWTGNVYLIEDDNGLILVDTGWLGNDKRIIKYILSLGHHPEDLKAILITHGHPDHYGSASRLKEITGARVLAHKEDTFQGPAGKRVISFPGLLLFPQPQVDEFLEEGQTLPIRGGIRVLHTPGHTPGSICLLMEKQGLLFTGDTLLSDGRNFSRSVFYPRSNRRVYWASVQRLTELVFEAACAGHGKPCMEQASSHARLMLRLYQRTDPLWWRVLRHLPWSVRIGRRFLQLEE